MTDEEAITWATLHGCKFAFDSDDDESEYFVEDYVGAVHPIEDLHNNEVQESAGKGQFGFDTREELAHAYCRYYKLGDYADDRNYTSG